MFHPDLHEQDPEKRKTYELLTQAINEARDRGDIELLELITKDPQAFILKQAWASVSLDGDGGLKELRALQEHLQARILEMIETLDELRASAEMEIFREVELDEEVIGRITAAQREELEQEIAGLKEEAERVAEEARELAGEVLFCKASIKLPQSQNSQFPDSVVSPECDEQIPDQDELNLSPGGVRLGVGHRRREAVPGRFLRGGSGLVPGSGTRRNGRAEATCGSRRGLRHPCLTQTPPFRDDGMPPSSACHGRSATYPWRGITHENLARRQLGGRI